ncbi:hypothetical protein N2152v2_008114 [Parachlorella kessleri]
MQTSEPSLTGAAPPFALETAPTQPSKHSEAGLGPAKPAFLASRHMVSEPTLSPAPWAADAASPAATDKGATLAQLRALQDMAGNGSRPGGLHSGHSGRPEQGLSFSPEAQPGGRPATPCTGTPTQAKERPMSWGSGSGTDGESAATPREGPATQAHPSPLRHDITEQQAAAPAQQAGQQLHASPGRQAAQQAQRGAARPAAPPPIPLITEPYQRIVPLDKLCLTVLYPSPFASGKIPTGGWPIYLMPLVVPSPWLVQAPGAKSLTISIGAGKTKSAGSNGHSKSAFASLFSRKKTSTSSK